MTSVTNTNRNRTTFRTLIQFAAKGLGRSRRSTRAGQTLQASGLRELTRVTGGAKNSEPNRVSLYSSSYGSTSVAGIYGSATRTRTMINWWSDWVNGVIVGCRGDKRSVYPFPESINSLPRRIVVAQRRTERSCGQRRRSIRTLDCSINPLYNSYVRLKCTSATLNTIVCVFEINN